MAKTKRKRPKRKRPRPHRPKSPTNDPVKDLDEYITLQRAKLRRDLKIKRVIEIFIMELRAAFPKSRQPKIRITMAPKLGKLIPPRYILWVNAKPAPKQHVLDMDPIIKEAAQKSMLFSFFDLAGSGTDFKTRDNDFIEKEFKL